MFVEQRQSGEFGNGLRAFFNRPGSEVATDLATHWVRHSDRKQIFEGDGSILGLQTESGIRYYRVEEAVLYDDDYTRQRWPHSRALEIASMESGEVVGYTFHSTTLTFIKTQGAENIQLSGLRAVDRLGDSLPGDENVLRAGGVAPLVGLIHRRHAQPTPFNFRGRQAFLLTAGSRTLSKEEIRCLEEELLFLG